MTSAKSWVTQYGATFKLLMDDPSGGHGGFMPMSPPPWPSLRPRPERQPPPSTADGLFNWAEKAFPQYFAPTGAASQTSTPYYFRYYAATGNYLASNAADNHLWALGLATGGKLLDLGLAAAFLGSAGCSAP